MYDYNHHFVLHYVINIYFRKMRATREMCIWTLWLSHSWYSFAFYMQVDRAKSLVVNDMSIYKYICTPVTGQWTLELIIMLLFAKIHVLFYLYPSQYSWSILHLRTRYTSLKNHFTILMCFALIYNLTS